MKKIILFLLVLSSVVANAQSFWTEVSPFVGVTAPIYVGQISIVDADIVWVKSKVPMTSVNQNGSWGKSTDAGVNWVEGLINVGNPNLGISSLCAVSATTAYVTAFPTSTPVGAIGGVWITQDSGVTWSKQVSALFNSIDSFPNFVHFWNPNDGIVVGDPESGYFEIYTTSNGGANWTRVPASNFPTLLSGEYGYSMDFDVKNNNIWFGTNYGRLYKSIDYGLHWDVNQSPVLDFNDPDFGGEYSFKNQNEGILTTKNFNFYRTVNGGSSWSQEFPTGSIRANSNIAYVPSTSNTYFGMGLLEVDYTRGSSYSTNGGLTWIDLNTVGTDPVKPYVAKFQSGTVGYCIGTYMSDPIGFNRFFKLTDPLYRLANPLTTNVFDANKVVVAPNPTSNYVKIKGTTINEIEIVDVLGKTILNEKYNAVNEVNLDLNTFQNGIYLAKISNNSGEISTVKIIKN